MNILLIVLAIVVCLIVVILIVALFTEKRYSVAREIVIDRASDDVFQYIRLLKNQENYSKWVMTDPNKKTVSTGIDGTVGFIYAWDGNKDAGKGEQEIKGIVEGKRMDVEIRFQKPFEAIATVPFVVEAISPQQSRFTWSMNSTMNYPMNIMLAVMSIDKMLGKDMEISLKTLKGILENK
jgi:hypothetical protein